MKNFIILFLLFSKLNAQNTIDYSAASIPDSLKKNANVVIKYEVSRYKYETKEKVNCTYHLVKTILNASGKDNATLYLPYDQFSKINDIEGNLYNGLGKKIKSLKNKDIKDYASYDGISIASDSRYKEIDFNYGDYPYSVEYIIETSQLNTHSSLIDRLHVSEHISQQHFETSYDVPVAVKFELFLYNLEKEVEKKEEIKKDRKITTFTLGPYKCKTNEALINPSITNKAIFAKFPDFKYSEYDGSMNSWKDYGNFILKLNSRRDFLPEDEKIKVKEIIATLTDDKSKIEALYKYMQSKTRYISISYGIGGHQPFPASDVAKLGYGDCKALSNYMYALLKEAGIKSNYVLISGGRNEAAFPYDKFVLPRFNHAILMVPQESDSIWLECTSQTGSCGYQGSFTGNRQALVIEQDNSRIVATKQYDASKNFTIRNSHVSIEQDGTCLVNCKADYHCLNADQLIYMIDNYGKEDFEKYLNKTYDFSYNIKMFHHEKIEGCYPTLKENLELQLPYYASKSGKRIFIIPNLFSRIDVKYKLDSLRKNELYLGESFSVVDTSIIKIPDGYKIESCPKDIQVSNSFGQYQLTFEKEEGQVKFIRRRVQNSGTFDKSTFNDYVKYNDLIYTADRGKIVLVTK